MRLLEASHTIEILREAGPQGLHVDAISQQNGVECGKLGWFSPPFKNFRSSDLGFSVIFY
jgi:hypothetical protein